MNAKIATMGSIFISNVKIICLDEEFFVRNTQKNEQLVYKILMNVESLKNH